MKKVNLFYLPFIAISLLLSGCSVAAEETPTMDDITFHEDGSEDDPIPRDIDLPTVGSDAPAPLEISAIPEYYNNIDLHKFTGQWNGYGVHYPSILKYGDTYYLYTSTPDVNVGIKTYSSKNLVDWNFVGTMGYVTKEKSSFAAKSPQVFHINDSFLMYFKSNTGYQIFKSDSPEGPFEEYSKIDFDSKYIGNFYLAPNGKMFYISGGEECASIYEMANDHEIIGNSKGNILSTRIDSYNGSSYKVNNPSISYVGGVAYLTYSSQDEKINSYRSYYVSAINPDFSSSEALATSFFNNKQGPVLINTNSLHGSVGLGDLKIIEGPDNVSYYGYYTSLESTNVRRFNISPIYLDKANLSISHRDDGTIKPNNPSYILSNPYDEIALSEIDSRESYVASFNVKEMKELYFSYHSSKNTFVIEFKENVTSLSLIENGLKKEISTRETSSKYHDVKVIAHKSVDVYLDGYLMVENYQTSFALDGKIGYQLLNSNSRCLYASFTNGDLSSYQQGLFKESDQSISATMCLEEESNISAENKFVVVEDKTSDFYGQRYVDLSTARDYVRYLVDVKEDARYGVELVLNTSFTKYESYLGVRLGVNSELMFKTSPLGDTGYCRFLSAEFDVNKGPQELLVENLSNANLRILSVRLVKTSKYHPKYSNNLANYVTSGIHYETDFRLNSSFNAHSTYEGVRSFAYVGDNTITNFKLKIEIGFHGGFYTSGFIGLGFRCDNFASSSLDDDESLVGYYLEISQFQTKLMKHQYGYGTTLGVIDIAHSVDEFKTYTITVSGNHILCENEDFQLFDIVDQMGFTSGHLAFGSSNVNGLLRNLEISKA